MCLVVGCCRIRANTYFRDYDEFATIVEDFNTPLHPVAEILYDDSLSADGGFDEGFFGYIIWSLAVVMTTVGVFLVSGKSVMWSASSAGVVSIPIIYATDVPNYALVFVASWFVAIGIISFYKR